MSNIGPTLTKPISPPAQSTAQTTDKKVIIDLGKQKKSKIKALRNGEGALLEDVEREVDRLRDSGVLAKGGPVVVFLVREKPKRGTLPLW
jgi:hypothetical protein